MDATPKHPGLGGVPFLFEGVEVGVPPLLAVGGMVQSFVSIRDSARAKMAVRSSLLRGARNREDRC